jgi:tetratricopeptide (TPR) repeat protein
MSGKSTLPLLLLLYSAVCCRAQNLHAPSEVAYIMQQSKLVYVKKTLTEPIDLSPKSLPSGLPVAQGDSATVRPYPLPASAAYRKYKQKGETRLAKRDWQKAIKYFKKALAKVPDDVPALSILGQAQAKAGDWASAARSVEAALALNYHDHNLHMQLYEILGHKVKSKEALEQLTLAHLLNRAEARGQQQLANAYAESGYRHIAWAFVPQYALAQRADTIYIMATNDWGHYAAVQALWQYEPGYAEKMRQISNEPLSIIREKEALINAAISYEQSKKKGGPALPEMETLLRAVKEKRFDDFIQYELVAPKHPEAMLLLSKERLAQLVDYLMDFRDQNN